MSSRLPISLNSIFRYRWQQQRSSFRSSVACFFNNFVHGPNSGKFLINSNLSATYFRPIRKISKGSSKMGKVMSMLSRRAQRFNAENRAHAAISKDKPTPAPRHKPSLKELEMRMQVDTDFLKKHNTKDSKLDDNLRDVYLVSHATEIAQKFDPENPDRPLPKRRTTADDLEFGVFEPEEIRKGRCTLRQALQFITDHNSEPAKHTAADIAAEFKLTPESTNNILKYFKTFKVYIPEPKPEEQKKRPLLPWEKKDTKKLE